MEVDSLEYKKSCLEKRRYQLLEDITRCANAIKKIDEEIAVLKSCQLEEDLCKDVQTGGSKRFQDAEAV